MATELKLSHNAAMILKAIDVGHVYGLGVIGVTGLPSGTVYPAVRRLERDGLIRSRWETQREAHPPRKCYTLTASGRVTLEAAERRYPMLANLIPAPVGENA